jgi:hypothetical protein
MVRKLKRQAEWAVSAFSVASPPSRATLLRRSMAPIADWTGGEDSWIWRASWPTSRGRWTKSCWRENEYLAAENRILKAQLKGRLKSSDAERATLGEIGHRVGRKVVEVSRIV